MDQKAQNVREIRGRTSICQAATISTGFALELSRALIRHSHLLLVTLVTTSLRVLLATSKFCVSTCFLLLTTSFENPGIPTSHPPKLPHFQTRCPMWVDSPFVLIHIHSCWSHSHLWNFPIQAFPNKETITTMGSFYPIQTQPNISPQLSENVLWHTPLFLTHADVPAASRRPPGTSTTCWRSRTCRRPSSGSPRNTRRRCPDLGR